MTTITRLRLPRPVTIRTLGDLGEQNQLVAHCPKCRHSRRLDLKALRGRYGLLSLRRLRARLRCTRCGARPPGLVHVFDNGAPFRGGR